MMTRKKPAQINFRTAESFRRRLSEYCGERTTSVSGFIERALLNAMGKLKDYPVGRGVGRFASARGFLKP